MENLIGIVDRHYRLSIKIRNPATRIGYSKALDYRQVDEATGIDLIHRFGEEDLKHVQEVLKQCRSVTLESLNSHYLISRLAKANTRRRQQFGQWRKHRKKLQSGLRLPNSDDVKKNLPIMPIPDAYRLELPRAKQGPLTSKPSTATRVEDSKVDLDDTTSMVSSSTYAMIAEEPGSSELLIPRAPKTFSAMKEFECPYCFTLCSGRLLAKHSWE